MVVISIIVIIEYGQGDIFLANAVFINIATSEGSF